MQMGSRHEDILKADSGPLTRAIASVLTLCGYLSAMLILLILAVVSYAIIQRYVLHTPLLWGDELIGYTLVAVVMLGAAQALRTGDHISMDLLSSHAGARMRRALAIWADLAVIAFGVVLGSSTWESIVFAIDFGSYAIGHIEIATWIPQLPMLLGSILLVLAAGVRLLQTITGRDR